MAERSISTKTNIVVCVVLILLTFLTVGVSFLPLPGDGHLTAGLAIGAIKAALVVLVFMHVLISGRLTWVVILVSGFFYLILITLTLADFMSRGLIPYTPGH